MPSPEPLAHPFDKGPFTTRSAVSAGINVERLRRSDLWSPFQGIRAHRATVTPTLEELCVIYAQRLPEGAVFSHQTAALLHGMPGLSALARDSRLHVSTPPPQRSIRAVGICGHKLDLNPEEVTTIHGLPVTTAARTWLDLSSVISVEDAVVLGDRLLWWRHPLATRVDLTTAMFNASGRRGVANARSAYARLTDRADSPPESRIRFRIAEAGLPPAIPNLPLFDVTGEFLGMPDLTFVEYREVYEYEGDHHRTDRQQWEKDIARVPRFERAGWHTTRGSRNDLANTPDLIRRLRAILRSKGWSGRSVTNCRTSSPIGDRN